MSMAVQDIQKWLSTLDPNDWSCPKFALIEQRRRAGL